MKDVTRIISTLIRVAKENELEYTSATVNGEIEGYSISTEIRIEKRQSGLYNSVNTIPEINLDSILPTGVDTPK